MRHVEPLYLLRKDGEIIALTYKCGRSSIVSAEHIECHYPEVVAGHDITVIVRDPAARLQSFFQFLLQTGVVRGDYDFIDKVLDGWFFTQPQVTLHTHEGVYLPTRFIKLEDLDKEFPDIQHLNASIPRISLDSRYRREELTDYYKEDKKLWDLLNRNS